VNNCAREALFLCVGKMAKYDKAKIKAEFLRRIAEGESHSAICRDDHMPSWTTIWNWTKADSEFKADLDDCKFERGVTAGWEVLNISRDMNENAHKYTHEMVAAKRAAMDGFKWAAARMAGRDGWADKVQVEHQATGSYVDALMALNAAIEADTDSKVGGVDRSTDAEEVRARTEKPTIQ
jgi:hypothetical protein